MVHRDDVTRNERGWRTGESHPRARLTDAVVIEIRDLHEHRQMRYQQIIELFAERKLKLTYHVVRALCLYKRRLSPIPNPRI